jgi:hypothetical protein
MIASISGVISPDFITLNMPDTRTMSAFAARHIDLERQPPALGIPCQLAQQLLALHHVLASTAFRT